MGIRASNQDTILLDNAKPGRRLSCSSERAGPAVGAEGRDEGGGLGSYAGATGEDVEGYTFAEEDFADRTTDGCDVGNWGYGAAFVDVPLHSIVELSVRSGKGDTDIGGVRGGVVVLRAV